MRDESMVELRSRDVIIESPSGTGAVMMKWPSDLTQKASCVSAMIMLKDR